MRDNIRDALLTPQTMICDDQAWGFSTQGLSPAGFARLRAWTTKEGPLLVLVSQIDIGLSVMNAHAGAVLLRQVQERFFWTEVVVLEHWPDHTRPTLDYVFLDEQGEPQWNRITPMDGRNLEREAWTEQHGHQLLHAEGCTLTAEVFATLKALI